MPRQAAAKKAPTNGSEPAAEWVSLDALKPWADNPRKNDPAVKTVADSIRRFGFGAPLLARANGEVIAGHTRLKAAQQLGLDRVPVRYLDLDPADAKLLALADNKTGEIATWDEEMLGAVLADLQNLDTDLLVGTGFDDSEIERLINVAHPEEPTEDPGAQIDRADELREKWQTERGQLWEIGSHRLLCGDSTVAADVARVMGGEKINVAFTSPPYAEQRKGQYGGVPADKYVDWFEAVQANVREHLAGDGSWFVNIKEHAEGGERHLYVKDLTIAHVRRWGWKFVDELCWVRAGVPGGWPNRFKNGWEPVFHFSLRGDIKFRPDAVSHTTKHAFDYSPDNGKSVSGSGLLGEKAAGFRAGMARPGNVLEIGSGGAKVSGDHPAEFPPALPVWFVSAYSDDADAVYDPFTGSGTTLVAAEQTSRRCYGIEIEPKYVAVTLERLAGMGLEPRLCDGSTPAPALQGAV
jgi:DNA modification methylase